MSTTTTTDALKQLMSELFRCGSSDIKPETGPGDLPGWDSLGHVSLMFEIQKQFGVHVPVEEALEVDSFTKLVEILGQLQSDSQ